MRAAALVVPPLAALLLQGCAGLNRVLGFEEQMKQAEQTARVSGRIETEGGSHGPLVVVLARVPDAGEEGLIGVDSFVRVRPGSYAFPVAAGRYQVGVYEDRNRNGLLDPGERTRSTSAGPILEVGPGGEAVDDIVLSADATSPPGMTEPVNVLELVARTPKEQRHFSLWAWSVQGALCEDLSDPKFGPKSGVRGLWEVMDFVNDGLAGIYLLEPYDPARIPVLFVHGISGHPQEFTTLIEGLDRTRFQPWFYFYPSGFGLDGLAGHLATLLERLQVEHGFRRLAVVAHSMGGLVSRGAIFKYREETGREDVRLFVTLSTPWGGDVTAEQADSAPVELPPAFDDMSPSSDYLRWLFYQDEDRKRVRGLPARVEHHMMFGFRMSGLGSTADDGSVTVASQARLEAQEQAASVRAFDYGHVEILHSPEAVARLNRLLVGRFR